MTTTKTPRNANKATIGAVASTAGLERRVTELADWFSDNPNTDDIADAIRVLVRDIAFACVKACEAEAAAIRKEGAGCHDGRYDWMADGAERCAEALRSNAQAQGAGGGFIAGDSLSTAGFGG